MAVVSTPKRASASVKIGTIVSGKTVTYSVPLGGIDPTAIGTLDENIYDIASALAPILEYGVTGVETSLTQTLEQA